MEFAPSKSSALSRSSRCSLVPSSLASPQSRIERVSVVLHLRWMRARREAACRAARAIRHPRGSIDPRRMLSAILAFAFEEYETDLAKLLGGSPTMVAAVPSTKPPNALQPLPAVVAAVAALGPLVGRPLRYTGVRRERHTVQPDLFAAPSRLDGQRILLVEDLWVRGATAATAVDVIEAAGGRAVVLAIGREVRRDFMSCAELLRVSGRPSWMVDSAQG